MGLQVPLPHPRQILHKLLVSYPLGRIAYSQEHLKTHAKIWAMRRVYDEGFKSSLPKFTDKAAPYDTTL